MAQPLPPIPPRIATLPRDHRGFPVPWFVQWFADGKPADRGHGAPDFRVIAADKMATAVKRNLCWICGQPLGQFLAFVIGPMCAINRIVSEPPSHLDCAKFSVKACPFLSRPRMRRNDHNLPAGTCDSGLNSPDNPGCMAIWVTKSYQTIRADRVLLFSFGPPIECKWFTQGRPATHAEAADAMAQGYARLMERAKAEGSAAVSELDRLHERALHLLPAA